MCVCVCVCVCMCVCVYVKDLFTRLQGVHNKKHVYRDALQVSERGAERGGGREVGKRG